MAADGICVLNGHMDTIPAGPRDLWTSSRSLTDQKDRLFGLGAGNMKGAVAALLVAYPGSPNEPTLARGDLADRRCRRGRFRTRRRRLPAGAGPDLLGDALICGEGPGAMGLAIAEKGVAWFRIKVRGQGGAGDGGAARRIGDSPARRPW